MIAKVEEQEEEDHPSLINVSEEEDATRKEDIRKRSLRFLLRCSFLIVVIEEADEEGG